MPQHLLVSKAKAPNHKNTKNNFYATRIHALISFKKYGKRRGGLNFIVLIVVGVLGIDLDDFVGSLGMVC